MQFRLTGKPVRAMILSLALCLCFDAEAQDTGQSTPGNSRVLLSDTVELNAFGGVSLFGSTDRGLGTQLNDGGVAGGRVSWNATKYVGLEFSYNFMVNNVSFLQPIKPGLPDYGFGNQIQYYAFNPVFNLLPRGYRIQPFITVGAGFARFVPTDKAKTTLAAASATYPAAPLQTDSNWALNYGGGIKFHISDHFGLRVDVRGFYSPNPAFNLNNSPAGGLVIPTGGHLNGFQSSIGLVMYLGHPVFPKVEEPPMTVPPLSAGTISGTDGLLCQGRPVALHATAADPAGHPLSYAWKLNGAAAGSNSADFSFTPNNAGDFVVQVIVSDPSAPARTVTAGPVTMSVKEYVQPLITAMTATPSELTCSSNPTGEHTARLSGSATGSACGGSLSYKWSVSEGAIANDTSANAMFDVSSLSFESGAQGQTKTVTATFTVTDETQKSVSQTTQLAVSCPPQYVRLPDVVFAKNGSRVNNCGKRILIDEAAPRLAAGDYNIVLVGHRDSDEQSEARVSKARGRRHKAASSLPLDEQRVLNAAAVLSGGTGACAKVEVSRIKIDWTGTDQTSAPDPGLCGTSNRAAAKERRGAAVTEADKNRRVEVYLVPRDSSSMPPAVKSAKALASDQTKSLGCPK